MPVVFTVVITTVAVAGTTAAYATRKLRVAQPTPSGIVFIDGGEFAIDLASALNDLGVATIHIGLDEAGVCCMCR